MIAFTELCDFVLLNLQTEMYGLSRKKKCVIITSDVGYVFNMKMM